MVDTRILDIIVPKAPWYLHFPRLATFHDTLRNSSHTWFIIIFYFQFLLSRMVVKLPETSTI